MKLFLILILLATPLMGDTFANESAQAEKSSASKKNRIRGLFGIGPNNELNHNANTISINRGAVGGIGYERKVSDEVALGVEAHTNGNLLLSVGFDF